MRLAVGVVWMMLCILAGCATNPFSGFDDPRPEGRFSLRERSRCEVPDEPDARWCDLPHEVRVFVERRQACDHFRGEPVPEPQDDPRGERRRQIETALRESCTGSDAQLAALRRKYRDDAIVVTALAGFDDDIEP